MTAALLVLVAANGLLSAAVMWLWAAIHGRLRHAYAFLGLLIGPFALVLLLSDLVENRPQEADA